MSRSAIGVLLCSMSQCRAHRVARTLKNVEDDIGMRVPVEEGGRGVGRNERSTDSHLSFSVVVDLKLYL